MYLPGRYLFMHITVTHQTGSLNRRSRVVERIGAQRFSNTRMSYIALLHKGGEVHEGQPKGRKGAHTINDKSVNGFPYDLNAYGHALAYVGMESDLFGEVEAESAARYFASLVLSGESKATKILPHRKFAWKSCPGDQVMAWLPEINRRFKKYVKNGLPGRDWLSMATKEDVKEAVREVLHDPSAGITSISGQAWSIRYTIERLWHRLHADVHQNTKDIPEDVWTYRHPSYISDNNNTMRHALLYAQESANRLRQTTVVDRPNGGDSSYHYAIGQIWELVTRIENAMQDRQVLTDEEVDELINAVRAAVPVEISDDVADELGERIAEGTAS
ncbi:hypothetical protein [Phytoactinopolyspora halophila]|nr:hypothetical protein [Phytoactinopolyspora halophila]